MPLLIWLDVLGKDADELLIGDQSLFAQAIEAYVSAGGKFEGIGGGNVATKVLTDINNLVEAGDKEGALARMSDYMAIMKTSIDNGVITGPAAVKYNELVQVKTELDNRYTRFRESLSEVVPAFVDQEAFREDGMFAGNPEVAEILNYIVDENGVVRDKREYKDALQEAVNNGELSDVTVQWLSQGATLTATEDIVNNLPRYFIVNLLTFVNYIFFTIWIVIYRVTLIRRKFSSLQASVSVSSF